MFITDSCSSKTEIAAIFGSLYYNTLFSTPLHTTHFTHVFKLLAIHTGLTVYHVSLLNIGRCICKSSMGNGYMLGMLPMMVSYFRYFSLIIFTWLHDPVSCVFSFFD